ncbi:MAG: YciI family protein [Pseudomonadota bacterium]
MNYLCLVYLTTEQLHSSPDSACISFYHELDQSGHLVAGQALQPVETATTIRIRNGQMSLTDGPFAETKEQLAGFYLIEAKDLNEAIHWASKIPPAHYGSIEVRPVRALDLAGSVAEATSIAIANPA